VLQLRSLQRSGEKVVSTVFRRAKARGKDLLR
jgi:hypothetical protein